MRPYPKRKRTPLGERFWPKVLCMLGTQCWEWQGARTPVGYGRVNSGGRGQTLVSSRASWELTYGAIPVGMQVCHRCDNPPCVNPAHLFLGTDLDNRRDMMAKGRENRTARVIGVQQSKAKCTDESVVEMRAAWAAGESKRSLARRYALSRKTVASILSHHTWKHVA